MLARALIRVHRALLVLALVLLAPIGAASWILPEDGMRIEWSEAGLLSNDGYLIGQVDPETGAFQAFADTFPTLAAAESPDGRWFAWSHGGGEEPRPGVRTSTDLPLGATEVADVYSGESRKLLDGAAGRLAAGPTHLAVAHARSDRILLYAWGAWNESVALDLDAGPGALEADAQRVDALAFSPDGRTIAVGSGPVVRLHDSTTGAPRSAAIPGVNVGEGAIALRFAFSPDGDRLAVLVVLHNGSREVRILDTAAPGSAAQVMNLGGERLTGISWSGGGLAVASTRYSAHEAPPPTARVQVFADTTAPATTSRTFQNATTEDVAWSPEGDRLAAGIGRRLVILDASLATVASYGFDAGKPRWKGEPGDPSSPTERAVPAAGALAAVVALTVLGTLQAPKGRR